MKSSTFRALTPIAMLALAACALYHPAHLEQDHETPTPVGPCTTYTPPEVPGPSLDVVDIECGRQVLPVYDPTRDVPGTYGPATTVPATVDTEMVPGTGPPR